MSWLLRKGCSVDAEDHDKMTPLAVAALDGHKDAVELLIQSGADVNHQSKKRMSPLHFAVIGGNTNVLRVLLMHGANVKLKNLIGQTPADLASHLDEKAAAKFIREFKPPK
jgi:ankyrin repeat protein